jgi:hypothetical protein
MRLDQMSELGRKPKARDDARCSLKGSASGAGPASVTRAVGIAQPGRPIRRAQQQQKERPVSLVFGSGPAAFRTLHDNLPFGRAHAPPPGPASLLQDRFENRKLIGHCHRFSTVGQAGVPYLGLSISSQVQKFIARETKTQQNRRCLNRIFILVERRRVRLVQTWAGSLEIPGPWKSQILGNPKSLEIPGTPLHCEYAEALV